FSVQRLQQEILEVAVQEGEVNVMRTTPPESAVAVPRASGSEAESQSPPTRPAAVDAPAATAGVLAADGPIPLVAGETLQINESDGNVIKETIAAEEMETKLAWREGMLLFNGDPLEKAIREVSRYTAIQIDVD